MKWLVVGLGNPGVRYEQTRHNAGFWVVELMAQELDLEWKRKAAFEAMMASQRDLVLLKPETYMNASGRSVSLAMRFYGAAGKQVIVIHDDLDLSLGTAKVSWSKGPPVHNGLLSVEQALGSKAFWRVRVGVDSRNAEERRLFSGETYVLKRLTQTETPVLTEGVTQAAAAVEEIIKGRYGFEN